MVRTMPITRCILHSVPGQKQLNGFLICQAYSICNFQQTRETAIAIRLVFIAVRIEVKTTVLVLALYVVLTNRKFFRSIILNSLRMKILRIPDSKKAVKDYL